MGQERESARSLPTALPVVEQIGPAAELLIAEATEPQLTDGCLRAQDTPGCLQVPLIANQYTPHLSQPHAKIGGLS